MRNIAISLVSIVYVVASCCVCEAAWVSSSFNGIRMPPIGTTSCANNNNWVMGMQVKIRIVGRKNGGEKWLDEACSVYETRLRSSTLDVETHWYKNDQDLVKGVEADLAKAHSVVLLDPAGKMRSSEDFTADLYKLLEVGGSRLVFVVGGAPGLPPDLKHHPSKLRLLSLSSMTFTHQFARAILMEQIYRASEIHKGSGYHK